MLTLGPGGKLLGSGVSCRLTTTVVATALHSPSPNPPARRLLVGAPFARGGPGAVHRVGRAASSSAACTAPSWAAGRSSVPPSPRAPTGMAMRYRSLSSARLRNVAGARCTWSCMRETRMCGWREASWDCHRTRASVGASQSSKTAGPWSRWAPPASTIARGGCNWFGLTTPAGPPHSRRRPHHRGCPSSRLAPRSPAPPLRSGRLRRVRRRRSLSPPLPPAADLTACVRTPCRRRTRSSRASRRRVRDRRPRHPRGRLLQPEPLAAAADRAHVGARLARATDAAQARVEGRGGESDWRRWHSE